MLLLLSWGSVVRCARNCGGCSFGALGGGGLMLRVVVGGCVRVVVNVAAAAAVAALDIIAEWWKLRHARRQRARSC